MKKEQATELLQQGVEWLSEFQMRLAAQDTWSLLVIFQAMDAAGKDGTIRHVMSGVNPQGVEVTSFKVPSDAGARPRLPVAHGPPAAGPRDDRHLQPLLLRGGARRPRAPADPRRAEDAEPSKGKDVWQRRFREINDWERYLTDNGTKIVKLFLNVSKDEQKQRFLDRIEEPESNWKFSASDARERVHWDEYQKAFGDMLSHTSTPWAPWHVIPADRKWFMRLAAGAVILDALMELDPKWPEPTAEAREEMLAAKAELLAEDGGTPPAGA